MPELNIDDIQLDYGDTDNSSGLSIDDIDFSNASDNYGSETTLDINTGSLYQHPSGMGSDEMDYLSKIQSGQNKKQDFFGHVLDTATSPFRGVYYAGASISATGGESLRRQYADAYRHALDGGKRDYEIIHRIFNPVSSLGHIQGAMDFVFLSESQKRAKTVSNNKILRAADNIKAQHERWLKQTKIAETGNVVEKVLFDVGGGVTTLAGSVGVAALTKSPAASLVFIGGIQKNQSYLEAKERGWDAASSDSISSVMGAVEGGLEMVGIGKMFEVFRADKIISSAIKTAFIEGTQEFVQTGAEAVIAQTSGLRDVDISGGVQDSLYAGFIGMLSGAPIGAVSARISQSGDVTKEQADKIAEYYFKTPEQLSDRAAEILNQEAENFDENDATTKKVGELLSRFTKGEVVDIKTELDAIQDISDESKQEVIDFIEKKSMLSLNKSEMVAAKGRVAALDKQIVNLDNDINKIKRELEQEGVSDKKREKLIERIDKRYDKRGELIDRRDSIFNDDKQMTEASRGEIIKEISIRGSQVTALGAKVVSESISSVRKGLREAKRIASTDTKAAQNVIIKTLKDSNLPNGSKGKFLISVRDMGKSDLTDKKIARFINKMNAEIDNIQRREISNLIDNTLKKGKLVKGGKKPIGKLGSPKIQAIIDSIVNEKRGKRERISEKDPDKRKEILSQRREQREDVRNEAADALQQSLATGKTDEESIIERRLLAVKAGYQGMTNEQMADLLLEINELITTGQTIHAAKDAARKEMIGDTRHALMEQLLDGKDIQDIDQKTLWERITHGVINNNRSRLAAASSGWYDFVDVIFGKNSRLSESLKDIVETSKRKKDRIVVEFGEKMTKAYSEIYGEKPSKIYLKMAVDNSVKDEIGVFQRSGDDKSRPWVMTRAEARKLWMELKDDNLRETLMGDVTRKDADGVDVTYGNGITEDMVDALDSYLSVEDKKFVDHQLELYQEIYPTVNEVYSRMYGVNLPFNEMYSPISRRRHKDIDAYDEMLNELHDRVHASSQSFLKTRQNSIIQIKPQSDIAVFTSYVAQSSQFISHAESMRDLREVFTGSDFSEALVSKWGKVAEKTLTDYLDDLSRGGPAGSHWDGSLTSSLLSNWTLSKIANKPNMAAKQFTSFVGYADGMPAHEFALGLADFAANPVKAIKILGEIDYMRLRGNDLGLELARGKQLSDTQLGVGKLGSSKGVRGVARALKWRDMQTIFTRLGDRSAIYVGGWALYRYQTKVLGKTHEQAIDEFVRVTDDTQQSTSVYQKSRWQSGTNPFLRASMSFLSAPMQFQRKEARALRKWARGQITTKEAAKTLFIYHVLIPVMFQYVANAFSGLEEDDEKTLLRAAILGNFNAIPLLGDAASNALARSFGVVYPEKRGGYIDATKEIMYEFANIAKDPDADIDFADIISAALTLVGVGADPLINAADAMIDDIPEGDTGKGVLRVLGYTEKTAEKATK